MKKNFFTREKISPNLDLDLSMDKQKTIDLMNSFGEKRLPAFNSVNIDKIPMNGSETL
jgi:hypothetical protein